MITPSTSRNSLPKSVRKRNILIWFIIPGCLLIALPVFMYDISFGALRLSVKKEDWDLFSTFIGGTLSPILSLLTLIITGYIVWEFNVYQKKKLADAESEELQQTTINLFKEFRSPQMSRARSMAWVVKLEWDKEANLPRSEWKYRKALIESMITENVVDDENIKITGQQRRAINDVIAFYTMLGLYSNNEKNIKELAYFYYPWWRAFLKELTSEWYQLTTACINNNQDLVKEGFDKATYIKHMCMNGTFGKLDEICGFSALNHENMICHFDTVIFPHAIAEPETA